MTKLKELANITTHLRHTINITHPSNNPVLVTYQHLLNEKINQRNTILIKEMVDRIKILEKKQTKTN
jgi:hypothetical protein